MSELLPCPFCGSSDVRVVNLSPGWRTVRCYALGCYARGPADLSDASPMEDAALVAAWNTRSTPPRAEVDVEALRVLARWIGGHSADDLPEDVQEAWSTLDDMLRALSRATNTDARGKGGNDAT